MAQSRPFRATLATAKDADIPTTWSDSESIVWKTKLPGRGASSPVWYDDRIFQFEDGDGFFTYSVLQEQVSFGIQ